MTPEQLQGWLQLGIGGLMLAALFLGFRRIWVFGWLYDGAIKDRDEWKTLALKAMGNTQDVAEAAKAHTTFTPEQAEMALRLIREAGRSRDGV